MKAAVQHRYGLPEDVVGLEDEPVPRLGRNEVLLRVEAAGVNWADWSMTVGKPYIMRAGYGLRSPRKGLRGTDVAGTVVDVGGGVTTLSVGDAVFGWCVGAFAEFAAVPEDHLVPMPAEISFEEAAGVAMAGSVALQALRDVANVRPGDRVLVNGASGGIGSYAVQIAKHLGAEVTGVCSTPNVEFVRLIGADHVIDYTKDDFVDGSIRYHCILDIADIHSLTERRRVLTGHGALIPNSGIGGPWFGSVGRIFKAWLASPFVRHKLRPFLAVTKKRDLEVLSELIESGAVTPMVGKTYSLADAGAAISHAGSGHARGKIVVTP